MKQTILDFLSYIKTKFQKNETQNKKPKTFEIYPYNKDKILNPSKKSFLHEYDIYTSTILDYDGVRDKEFYIADANIFKDYINEVLNNPETSFKSYIHDTIRSGYIPKNINCIRLTRNDQHYGNEVLASNILNYFKLPTAYYCKIQALDHNKQEILDHILSVDFISKGQELHPFNEYNYCDTKHIEKILEQYRKTVYTFYKSNKRSSFDEKENIDKKIQLDNNTIVKSFLVRACLMNDTDMSARNIGTIHNKEKNAISFAPNFDLEFCLIHPIKNSKSNEDTIYNISVLKENLLFISENYPHVLNEFVKETDQLLFPIDTNNNPLETILQKAKTNGEPTIIPKSNLYKNYETICCEINHIKTKKEKNENEINK